MIRLATTDDVPSILAISNHYVLHSAANFAIEPESLESWLREFEATSGKHPWFVAVSAPGRAESLLESARSAHPLTPSLQGRRKGSSPLPEGEGGERSEPGEGGACDARDRLPDEMASPNTLTPNPSPKGRGEQTLTPNPSPGGRGEEILGFAKASPWKGRCAYAYSAEITVYVHPDHHRRGIGRALYARLLETMKAQGYQTVLGGIALPNPASVALHESLGMTCSGVLKRVGWKFGKWHDVGYWQGILNESTEPPKSIRPVREVTG